MRIIVVLLGVFLVLGCSDNGKEQVVDIGPGDVSIKPVDNVAQPDVPKTPPDVQTKDVPATPDIGLPPGWLEFCISDADCAEWGLLCITDGPIDEEPMCSKECTGNADCPDMLVCKVKGTRNVCQVATFCDYCDADSQCAPNGKCIAEKPKEEGGVVNTFCSYPCKKDDPASCGAGNYCKKSGAGLEDYFCFPMFGACKGDGTHCMPCVDNDDCLKGNVCHENPTTFERYCGKICQVKMDCPKGFGCYDLAGEEYPLCTLEVDGFPVETCYKGNKAFCEPCMKDYECQSDICYNLPVANKYFCSFNCVVEDWPPKGCPPGLFCAPNRGESGGDVCVPPTGFGCQGFLNCMGVDCPKGEKCVDGFCQPK